MMRVVGDILAISLLSVHNRKFENQPIGNEEFGLGL
jgi:hypothetical protein